MYSTGAGSTFQSYASSLPVVWNFTVGANGVVSGTISEYATAQLSASASNYKPSSDSPNVPGYATASFNEVIYWSGISSITLNNQIVSNFNLKSDSGFDYIKGPVAPVPEPSSYALMLAGMGPMVLSKKFKRIPSES
jgi:hypothetical protein